ncbi:MAG: CDP-diacylglycerol--glycerol-3-phosphate 3-phosphatidyltransferase [Lachnospiraceae bacterium]|nr:CDP-diacylglycerol--glycerol-3-phosphate 3-phosphatidyltransferase [Lachnospiraceae bacterium]
MNLPNKLTIVRVILIVPFILLLLGSHEGWGWFKAIFGEDHVIPEFLALAAFIIASLTDMLDGKIARKYNLVTNFGKFMDPLADKLLVCAALIVLVEMGRIPSWIVVVIISREFIISGFRLIASDKGVVIAASYWGKFKTTFQMIMIGMMIVEDVPAFADFGGGKVFGILTTIIMVIALGLTIISLVDYVWKNKDVMKDTK